MKGIWTLIDHFDYKSFDHSKNIDKILISYSIYLQN